MRHVLQRLVRDDSGQDMAEYAMLLGLVGLAVITAVGLLGGSITGVFGDIGSNMEAGGLGG